jgi:hypothetical protein
MIIAIEHFIMGRPLQESTKTLSDMAGRILKKRVSSSIPLLSRVAVVVLCFTDGMYLANNIDAAPRD